MASNFRADWQDFLGFTREEIAPVSPIPAVVSRSGQTEPFDIERVAGDEMPDAFDRLSRAS